MGKTLKPLIIGILIGVVGLYAYQNPDVRSQVSEFVRGILDSVSEAPAPTPTHTPTVALAIAPSPTVTPTQVVPTNAVPTLTATPTPTVPPDPSPTATATIVPSPTPIPAAYAIEVVSAESLGFGNVDFLLDVRNVGELESDEVAQVEMSVDGGAPELVNIIGNMSAGESKSFVFTHALTPGTHILRFTVGGSDAVVSVSVESGDTTVYTPTPTPAATPTPEPTVTPTIVQTPIPLPTETTIPTNTPTSTITPLPTNTTVPIDTPTPIPAPETAISPDLRHLDEKTYMLELINTARARAGLNPVVLGDNIAAQLHAEAALENCFASHWGIDGLKPYMRYSLAGGYQSNGENGSGSDYCIKASDGYRAIRSINTEIREVMEGWMDSPGHRRNILDRWHKKVNIGLAWDKYNFLAYQHFEGDYVEYDELPSIEDDILSLSGRTKNGVRFDSDRDLGIQIYYDPPPHALTRGQVTRTYCYGSGLQIAALREPLTGGAYWTTDSYVTTHNPCPDPYDVPADARGPRSHDEAHRFWKAAYDLSQKLIERPTTVPWITARKWSVREGAFSVTADLSDLIAQHGDGVYTILVWGKLGLEDEAISEYSIFHGVTPPDTYTYNE